MMCQRIGRSPIGIMGFGMLSESGPMRSPSPPQKRTSFTPASPIPAHEQGLSATGSSPSLRRFIAVRVESQTLQASQNNRSHRGGVKTRPEELDAWLGQDPGARNRNDQPRPPLTNERELLGDLALEVPRQDQDVVGPLLLDPLRRVDRNVRSGQKLPCLYGFRSTVNSRRSLRMPQ